MGDIIVATGKTKDSGGSSTIKCPMLSSTNYTIWAIRMKLALQIHKAWEIVEGEETTEGDKNCMAKALLFQSIPESLILQVGELDTAKKV